MFITCQTLVRYVVTFPNIHLCADIKDPSVNAASERSAILMTRRGCHQWQYIHAVFDATSQYVSVKTDCCVWTGLQGDRQGSLVLIKEHIHLNTKTSYYALVDVNMPFPKQGTLSQFAHSNYYCR